MRIHPKAKEKGFPILVLFLFLLLLLWGTTATPVASMADMPSYFNLHEGWSQIIDGVSVPLEDIRDFYPVEAGEWLTFTCTLPELKEGMVFLFYTQHQEVICTVDGVVIQNFTMDDHLSLLKTPGSAWNQVDLEESMSGSLCTLMFRSQLESYSNVLNPIYFIENVDVDSLRLSHLLFYGLVAFVLLLLMVISCIIGAVWKGARRKAYFIALGQLYLVVLMWMLADLNAYDLIFGRPVLSYLIGAFFIRLLPLALVSLLKHSIKPDQFSRVILGLEVLTLVNFILPWMLLFACQCSLLESLILNRITMFAVAVVILGILMKKAIRVPLKTHGRPAGLSFTLIFCSNFHQIHPGFSSNLNKSEGEIWCHLTNHELLEVPIKYKELEVEEYPGMALVFLIAGGLIDMVTLYITPQPLPLLGVWTTVGFLLYTAVIFLLFVTLDAKMAQEQAELTQAYQKLQNTSLIQQIKAHFIFNVLNSISAFCKEDGAKADKAIRTFAAYLRSYLFLINQQENILIESELDMVKHYLTMEQMRFGRRLSFTVECQYTKFKVPPLSIQTLVENAVIHGIREKPQGGTITITTRQQGGYAQVVVSDTGVGFDTSQRHKGSSVGLSNVKKRVRIMSDGTVTIHSKVGEGTKIVMMIPLSDQE